MRKRGDALADFLSPDHFAILVDPIRQRAFLRLDRDLDGLTPEVEVLRSISPRNASSPLAGRRRHQDRTGAARFVARAAQGGVVEEIGFVPNFEQPSGLAFRVDAELGQHGVDVGALAPAGLVGDVAHMEDELGLGDLFERGAEGGDQRGRQVGDESDRVGKDGFGRRATPDLMVGSSVANSGPWR